MRRLKEILALLHGANCSGTITFAIDDRRATFRSTISSWGSVLGGEVAGLLLCQNGGSGGGRPTFDGTSKFSSSDDSKVCFLPLFLLTSLPPPIHESMKPFSFFRRSGVSGTLMILGGSGPIPARWCSEEMAAIRTWRCHGGCFCSTQPGRIHFRTWI